MFYAAIIFAINAPAQICAPPPLSSPAPQDICTAKQWLQGAYIAHNTSYMRHMRGAMYVFCSISMRTHTCRRAYRCPHICVFTAKAYFV